MRYVFSGVSFVSLFVAAVSTYYKTFVYPPFTAVWIIAIGALLAISILSLVSLCFGKYKARIVANLWIAICSLLTTYLILDLIAGYLLITPLSPLMQSDQVVHHRLVPNAVSPVATPPDFATVVTTNSFGLRGEDIEAHKKAGEYRILMLGDSFTMGKGVEDHQTFSVLLEELLNDFQRDGEVRVLNGGVDSYSPVLSYLLLENDLVELEPDLVVLNLDMSDLPQEQHYRSLAQYDDQNNLIAVQPPMIDRILVKPVRKLIINNLYLTRLMMHYIETESTGEHILDSANYALVAHTIAGSTTNDVGAWDNLFDSILNIKKFCDERGIGFMMTIYPWGHQVNEREWQMGRQAFLPPNAVLSDRPVEIVGKFASANNVPTLNLFPAFRNYKGDEKIYYDYDMHWRPVGHKIMADNLFEYIIGQGLLPAMQRGESELSGIHR